MKSVLIPAAALAAIALLAPAPAAAVTWEATNAAGICQGALPAFAGSLRARPLAIGNEGTTDAFVTCSLDSGDTSSSKVITRVSVNVLNRSGATREITCTLVDGWSVAPDYVAKSTTLFNGSRGMITWVLADLPDSPTRFSMPNFSCALAPGVSIEWIGHDYTMPVN